MHKTFIIPVLCVTLFGIGTAPAGAATRVAESMIIDAAKDRCFISTSMFVMHG